jgi:hypothetical protein
MQLTRIQLPYLHWDTFGGMKRRLKAIKTHMNDDARADVLNHEDELIWQYLRDPGGQTLHPRRTLDQYGYPSLASTEARDFDQVLYKRTRPKHLNPRNTSTPLRSTLSPAGTRRNSSVAPMDVSINEDQSKVIMVDQLWLWVLNKRMFHRQIRVSLYKKLL